jgi:hypothetical protein
MTAEQPDSRHKHALDIARAQAAAYVWGRQDAGESDRDTGYSIDFANWWAARKLAYLEQQAHFLPNLESAFLEWRRQQPAAEALPDDDEAAEQAALHAQGLLEGLLPGQDESTEQAEEIQP